MEKFQRYAKLSDNYWWFRGMRHISQGLLDRCKINNCGRKALTLDIGCGSGASLPNTDAIGMDISLTALSICRKIRNNRLLQADAESLPFRNNAFTVVTAQGVIEHLDADKHFLQEVYRVTKKDGYLLILTSAYRFLWSHHDRASGHVRRYVKNELLRLIEDSGFKVIKISYVNFFLFPVVVVIRYFQKLTGIDKFLNKEDLVNLPRFINYFLIRVLYLEAALIKKYSLTFGVSLVCLAQKPE